VPAGCETPGRRIRLPGKSLPEHNHLVEGWYRRVHGLLVHEVGSEFVLLDIDADRVHQLNPTASLIWRELEAARGAEDIARRVAETFDVEWEHALDDVRGILDRFAALSLIVPQEP